MEKLKSIAPHALAHLIFFLVVSVFFFPLYQGKDLVQSDNVQLRGTLSEVADFQKEEGRIIKWSNKEFSGMPTLTGSRSSPYYYFQAAVSTLLKAPVLISLFLFSGFYILLSAFNCQFWVRSLGSFFYAFSTFNLISLEAGHDNKVYAMAFMAPILAGVVWAYRGNLTRGMIVTALATGYQVYFGHIQISYYTIIILLTYTIYQLVTNGQQGQIQALLKPSVILIFAGILGVMMVIPKIWAIQEYSAYSNRSGSELRQSESAEKPAGLDKDYAYRWSNGQMEIFTIAFPYFHGGASMEPLGNKSNTGEVLRANRVDRRTADQILSRVPLYWGEQPGTAGPIYFGILVVFLFVLGYFLLDKSFMIWATSLCVLGFLLSMGKNLQWFSDLFFDYIPLYNKFRSVTMIMSIPQLVFPLVASLALTRLLDENTEKARKMRAIKVSTGIVFGVGLFFLLTKKLFFDFASAADVGMQNAGYPDWLMDAIVSDRVRVFNGDIIRSLVLTGLFITGLFLLYWQKIQLKFLVVLVFLISVFDLWMVNRRYIRNEDYFSSTRDLQALNPSQADLQIQADQTYYRVLNLTVDPFNEGVTSFHHHNIGGYNAIKIQRYQDLIERYISTVNEQVLNMLNTKYFIVDQGNGPYAQLNGSAFGNAWLVNQLEWVDGPNEEIEKLGQIDLAATAVIDANYQSMIDETNFSGAGTISLTQYDPEYLAYDFQSSSSQFAVFSEIWFGPGWVAKIDGNEVPHQRVNYVLRGLKVEPGEHKIEFFYQPKSQKIGEVVAWSSSFLVMLLLIGAILVEVRRAKS